MIQSGTILDVSDNSGAKKVICIKVLGGSRKFCAKIFDIIKVSIKNAKFSGKVKIGSVYNAFIINTKYRILRCDGSNLKFDRNSVIILDDKLEMVGSSINGFIPKELYFLNKKYKFIKKIISLSKEII
ncbi:large ribosomal subunit protein uL14 [Candidatus Vidania fulgoroideorum]